MVTKKTHVGIMGVLFLAGFVFSAYQIFVVASPPSVFPYTHFRGVKIDPVNVKLSKTESINGEFTAHQNNLGIISLRISATKVVQMKDEDYVVFTLQQKGDPTVISSNRYYAGQFLDNDFFDFGIPIIGDSKGITYEFNIRVAQSPNIQKNPVYIPTESPHLVSKYLFFPKVILQDPNLFINYVIQKITFAVFQPGVAGLLILNMLPFIYYAFWISTLRNTLEQKIRKYARKSFLLKSFEGGITYLFLIFIPISIDIFLVTTINDLQSLAIVLMILLILAVKKLEYTYPFAIAMVTVTISAFASAVGNVNLSNKAAIWTFYLLAVGAIYELVISRIVSKHE